MVGDDRQVVTVLGHLGECRAHTREYARVLGLQQTHDQLQAAHETTDDLARVLRQNWDRMSGLNKVQH